MEGLGGTKEQDFNFIRIPKLVFCTCEKTPSDFAIFSVALYRTSLDIIIPFSGKGLATVTSIIFIH